MNTKGFDAKCAKRTPAGINAARCGDLVNAEAMGNHLGVSGRTVLRMAKEGSIPCVRINRLVRFDMDDVDRSLNRR